jgi:hypothetical protein
MLVFFVGFLFFLFLSGILSYLFYKESLQVLEPERLSNYGKRLLIRLKLVLLSTSIVMAVLAAFAYTTEIFFPLNIKFYEFWIFSVIYVVVYSGWLLIISAYVEGFNVNLSSPLKKMWKAVGVYSLVVILLLLVTSSALFRSDSVSNIVKLEKTDKTLFKQIQPKYVRLVPKQTALMLADKTLGSVKIKGKVLGSQLEVDDKHATIQKVNGKMYWIIPLRYKGVFKQFSFGDIPGYIKVDASDPSSVAEFVKGYSIRYSLDAYFDRWAKRRLWQDDISQKLVDFSFEVDDTGRPYVVATVVEPRVGFAKYMPIGVKILDVQTGEIKFYPMDKVPNWVDRVIPEQLIAERLDEKGLWHNGIIAALFTKDYIWQLTDYGNMKEMFFIEDGSGKTYWVSGVTSVGKDNSIIALVAVNTKTGKAYWIPMSGPTEVAVKDVVESSLGVNKQVWEAKLPILYNIYGKLVWVSVVIDKKRAYPIKYALVDATNISHYVVKKTFLEALNSFFKGQKIPSIKGGKVYFYSGKANRYNFVGNKIYLWADHHIWIGDVSIIPECGVIQKNDNVYLHGFSAGKYIEIKNCKILNLKK